VLFFWLKTAYTSFPFIQSPQAFQRFHPTFVRQSGLWLDKLCTKIVSSSLL
jgi:hypothetical protein